MKEMIIKMFIGMIINSIKTEDVIRYIEKLKKDLTAKAAASEGSFDDMAVAAFLGSEDQILTLLEMSLELAKEKIKTSESTKDDMIWLPICAKVNAIIDEMQKKESRPMSN
jgi:hypothetical protein